MTDNPGMAAMPRRAWERTVSAMRAAALPLAALALAGCNTTMPAPSGLTASPAATVAYNRDAAFSVGVAPDRAPPLRLGETLGFRLSSSADGYGHLYLLNASGGVLALAENLPLWAGGQAAFPSPGAGFAFRASPPAGIERVLFLATRQPFAGFAGGAAGTGPVQIPISAEAFVEALNAATRALPKGGWALAEERIEIVGG